jgi:hypothetical protein
MLLAEELALVAVSPKSGRHQLGTRDDLNACLAGLLVAELMVDGHVRPGPKLGTLEVVSPPGEPAALAAAAEIVAEKGPEVKAVLSHMSRGLTQRLGTGTWDAMTAGLVDAGVLAPAGGGLLDRHELVTPAARDAIVARLRGAAAGDGPIEPRTALVLALTGPAQLLEVVAPDREGRKHARRRIDHALDQTDLEPIGDAVRKLIAETVAIAAAVASTGAVISSS